MDRMHVKDVGAVMDYLMIIPMDNYIPFQNNTAPHII